MEIVLSQFVKSLAESGLMNESEIEAFINTLPLEKKPDDGAALARELVRQNKLTKFQAQAVYQGKVKALILGDYVVLDRIGQGGMGQVFQAEHRTMERVVALKTLPPAATKSENAVQRFHREVKVAARLSHPNIVTAYDAGESDGLHYLVMEYVDGSDLASHVREHGRLPVDTALDYLVQAARGLEYAHAKRVIHRDMKPSNLLLDKKGNVKILDMGLARLNREIGPEDQTSEETLTGTGQMMGTIDFMPPEQAENTKTADERSDIYSLGCTLYYLLTGKAIYSGDTTVMKIIAHREHAVPSLRAELTEIPEQLDGVYQKMVAKRPEDRYGSMSEVIAELEKCAAPPPEELAETARFSPRPRIKTERDEPSIDLNLPVVSPMDDVRRTRPKKTPRRKTGQKQILVVGVALSLLFVLLLLGVVFMLRTPKGTLAVTVNEPDAQITVDGGKVTLKSPGGEEPVEVEIAEGAHTLKVTKGGFETFTDKFSVKRGGRKAFEVTLVPSPVDQAVPDVGKTAASSQMRQAQPDLLSAEEEVVPPPDPAVWKALLPADAPAPAIAPFDAVTAKKHQQAWAEYLGVPVEEEVDLGDGVKLTMVLIPPGEFVMGSPVEERTRFLEEAKAANDTWAIERIPTEGPQHRVRITKPFRLGRHEVTVGQFREFVEETGYKTDAEQDGKDPDFEQTDEHPVANVSWNDAMAFCQWLSEKAKKETGPISAKHPPVPGGKLDMSPFSQYVLPREAQWEYACRAGTTTFWHCGDDAGTLQEHAWFRVNPGGKTHAVGQLKANAWSVYDVHGNVWEWCADRWATDYYAQSPPNDPSGPPAGSSRVNRGGYWNDHAGHCRSANRSYYSPGHRNGGLGFRLASVLAER